jgi:hypothetical protein
METAFTIIGFAISALAILIALLIYQLNRRDKRMERLIKGEVVKTKYIDAAGCLAFNTARALHNKIMPDGTRLCNGEVEEAMKYYKECEHRFDDYKNESNILHNVKGG